MIEALDRIVGYLTGFDRERFLADTRTQDAVVRNLEWHRIIGLRHRVVHD